MRLRAIDISYEVWLWPNDLGDFGERGDRGERGERGRVAGRNSDVGEEGISSTMGSGEAS